MKKHHLIIASLLLAIVAIGANIIEYFPPTGRVLRPVMESVDPSPYFDNTNFLIDVAYPTNLSFRFWIATNGSVRAMTSTESNAVVAAAVAEQDAALRSAARSPLNELSPNGLVTRAFILGMVQELNNLRDQLNFAKTNLAGFTNSATLNPRTLGQVRTFITNAIAQGTAD